MLGSGTFQPVCVPVRLCVQSGVVQCLLHQWGVSGVPQSLSLSRVLAGCGVWWAAGEPRVGALDSAWWLPQQENTDWWEGQQSLGLGDTQSLEPVPSFCLSARVSGTHVSSTVLSPELEPMWLTFRKGFHLFAGCFPVPCFRDQTDRCWVG